jgi:hypothetical protein
MNTGLVFSDWKSNTGFDQGSSFSPNDPTGVRIFVRPNLYEPGRANIAIYNWDLNSSVDVDLSGVVANNTAYEIRDAENFFGPPVASGVYHGGKVTIPMTSAQASMLKGTITHFSTAHTTEQFGAFIVVPGNASSVLNPPTISPKGGNFSSSVTATISHSDSSAAVRYTTDGSQPTANSPLCTGPIAITSNTTLKAIAVKGSSTSTVRSVSFTIQKSDTTAPQISAVQTGSVTRNSAVVTWTTDEPADGQVQYGTTTALGVIMSGGSALGTVHQIQLSGLSPDSVYYLRVKSADAAGNLATSSTSTFTTLAAPDTTAPKISGVTALNISTTSATIAWQTDEDSGSVVFFGTTASYGLSAGANTPAVKSHQVPLTNLAANTTYHFRVRSQDNAGNLAVSNDLTFKTLGSADSKPPALSGVTASFTGGGTATIRWSTNEPADSLVQYGKSRALESSSPVNPNMVKQHVVRLTNLEPNKLYFWRVVSRDAAGNVGASRVYRTLAH